MIGRLLLLATLVACGQKEEITDFQVRVVWDISPETRARIVWTEDSEHPNSYIEFGSSSNLNVLKEPDQEVRREQYHSKKLFESNSNPIMKSAEFSDLQPNTEYFFRIRNSGASSATYKFITAPLSGNFKLILGGDSRSDVGQRRKMNRSIASYIDQNPETLALVHGGDYVADGNDWRQWSIWLNDLQEMWADDRILPIIPTRGNHETDPILYEQIFGISRSTYFTTSLPHLDLITLDSEISVLGDQFQWLTYQLGISRMEKDSWIFTNYHRPAYPAVKQPASTLRWAPVFDQFRVDIAFESDGHTFKKTAPISAGKIDHTNGVIYMGEGGLGVKQRQPKQRWYFQEGGVAFAHHHFIAVEVNPQKLTVQGINDDLEVFHEFTLNK